jgi:phosphoribosyl 1,2-cyclic phosphate phosphodiesterase
MRLTVLGTGTSFGIPQIGCACAVCRSDDPRDRRSRTSAIVEAGGGTILIDTPPELRLQLVGAEIAQVDAVLYTHEHADHTSGIDDLRMFSLKRRAALPVYGPAPCLAYLGDTYRYIFDDRFFVPDGTSKPRLALHPLDADVEVTVAGIPVLPIAVDHGYSTVFGYRFGDVAYVTDVKTVPPQARSLLRGVKVLVMSALWWRPHPTHQSIPEAIEVAREVGARLTYLTHLSHETAHRELLERLPAGIEPAYDGLTLEVPS